MKEFLLKNGFVCYNIETSHHHFKKIDNERIRTTVPIHGKKELSKGLESAILRQTGLKKKKGGS